MSILRMQAVLLETGHLSHASIYNGVNAGLFTEPVLIGQRAVGWPHLEVAAINAARIAGKAENEIRALVVSLHQARCGAGEQFKSTWKERSNRLRAKRGKGKRKELATV